MLLLINCGLLIKLGVLKSGKDILPALAFWLMHLAIASSLSCLPMLMQGLLQLLQQCQDQAQLGGRAAISNILYLLWLAQGHLDLLLFPHRLANSVKQLRICCFWKVLEQSITFCSHGHLPATFLVHACNLPSQPSNIFLRALFTICGTPAASSYVPSDLVDLMPSGCGGLWPLICFLCRLTHFVLKLVLSVYTRMLSSAVRTCLGRWKMGATPQPGPNDPCISAPCKKHQARPWHLCCKSWPLQ
jgi:hypothetical protein